jgi:transposase
MDLHAELERIIPDSALADDAWRAIRELLDDAQQAAAAQIARRDTELHAAQTKIQALVLELAHLRRMRFGAKSEALGAETKDLFQETLASDVAAAEAELAQQAEATGTPATPRPKRAGAGRQTLPEHLPRIEHRHEPESCTCGQCGKDLVKIGEDISEQLDVEPAKFFVHRHIRPQYACRGCETVTAAPIPPAVIDGGMAATGLLAWVIVGKYLDHLPLYRLERIAARDGVTLSRSTLAEWVGRIGVALQPLADRLTAILKTRAVLHADETPVQQLDPGNGKTKRAYLWAYRSNALETGPPLVVFDYQTSRSGAHARNFLADWQGHLMVDDFGGYKALFAAGVTELGCLAHARRKFFDLNAAQPNLIAQQALDRIAALYAIEARGRDLSVAERAQLRQTEVKPLLTAMHTWLLETRTTVANGGGTAKAMDYSLKRWAALSRYAERGDLPIDNNPVENAIRPICLGKKNWLFTGSERAGQRAAAIQSLLATAALNGLDPASWLRESLEKLPTCRNSQIDSLLPIKLPA